MKKWILFLAIGLLSFGVFAQDQGSSSDAPGQTGDVPPAQAQPLPAGASAAVVYSEEHLNQVFSDLPDEAKEGLVNAIINGKRIKINGVITHLTEEEIIAIVNHSNCDFIQCKSTRGQWCNEPGDTCVCYELNCPLVDPVCGDGACNGKNEGILNCPGDCYCGNGTCDPGEHYATCLQDCGVSNPESTSEGDS